MSLLRRLDKIAILDGVRARTLEREAEITAQRKRFYRSGIEKSVEPRLVVSEIRRLWGRAPIDLVVLASRVGREGKRAPVPTASADLPEFVTQLAARLEGAKLHPWRWAATTETIKQAIERYVGEQDWTSQREMRVPSGVGRFGNKRIRCEEASRADLCIHLSDDRRVIVEIDRIDKSLSLCKLQRAVDEGDEAVWVRWGMPCREEVPQGVHVIHLPFPHRAFWRRERSSARRKSGAASSSSATVKRAVSRVADATPQFQVAGDRACA